MTAMKTTPMLLTDTTPGHCPCTYLAAAREVESKFLPTALVAGGRAAVSCRRQMRCKQLSKAAITIMDPCCHDSKRW
eukprot:CAMPEP_0172839754 /NCGR_PEP_ID=MMETSP1075-20121228/28793_1 /TAXON_ID=2916 /ORGANISM="Ceratium fusus, Strain PA161109" /LENGTH=76 /DNA_ID=CAMNT_0013683449 /DNA_START=351 /DNA_END=578 /DNA_ORIENTATION=-